MIMSGSTVIVDTPKKKFSEISGIFFETGVEYQHKFVII